MTNKDTKSATITKAVKEVVVNKPPMEIRILEEQAKSSKVDYAELPEGVRGFLDSMAMSLLDQHSGKLMVFGYEMVGKSFLIEQLAFNKDVFIKKSSNNNIIFVMLNDHELGHIKDQFDNWKDYIQYVTAETGAQERDICFVVNDIQVAADLSDLARNSKIIFESNVNTLQSILRAELSGDINIWGSWSSHDANTVFVKKSELINLLEKVTKVSIEKSFGYKQLDRKKITVFVNTILEEILVNILEDSTICVPPGIFAVSLRRLAGYLALGTTSDLVSTKGAPTFAKSIKKTIENNIELFEAFVGMDDAFNFFEGGGEMHPDDLMPESPGQRKVLELEQEDIEELMRIKKARLAGEGPNSGANEQLVFSQMSTLADRIKQEVIGQDQAIEDVVNNLIIPAAGLNDPRKPISSILLLGPTGVGKTKMAETLAKEVMNKPMNVIRLDMSEYAQQNEAVKLFGSPSGYIGHEKGGVLTSAVLKNPNSLILLDEVEKAHPVVWDAFLQVFDAGRMTSGKGEEVDFTKTLIMMTSNLGSAEVSKVSSGFKNVRGALKTYTDSASTVMKEVERYFRPELLNRFDSMIMMNSLTIENAKKILIKEIEIVFGRAILGGFDLTMPSDDIIDVLLEKANIIKYGAREIQRIVKRDIATVIATSMLEADRDSTFIGFAIDEKNVITATA